MAEALAIAGSIIKVIQLTATVTNLCFQYMGAVKGASKDISDLMNELYALRGVFEYLSMHLKSTPQTQNSISSNPRESTIQLLDLPNGPLKRCYNLLRELETELVNRLKLGRHLVWPFKEKEILKYIARLERDKSLFGLAMHGDHMALSAEIERYCQTAHEDFQEFRRGQKRLIGDIQDVHNNVEDLQQQAKRQKTEGQAEIRAAILGWLNSTDHHAIQDDMRDRWHPGTCGWIFETDEFKDWISNDRTSRLLCTGIPGAGKTVSTSVVLDHLTSRFANDNVGIAFIYFNFQDRENQKAANVIGSLIKQLACQKPELSSSIEKLYDMCKKDNRRPNTKELKNTLDEISKTDFTRVIYVFDALDECDEKNRKEFLNEFILRQGNATKVFATSRPHPLDVKKTFEHSNKLEITANNSDIELFVRSKFEGAAIESSLLKKIVQGLLDRSKGMFLLAALQTEHLLQQISPRQMERALETMSPDLDTAYGLAKERIMQQVPPRRNLAFAVLEWVVHATRPLKVIELQEALAVERGDTELDKRNITAPEILVDVCAGLITIDTRSSTVHVAHFTVQAYLLGSGRGTLEPCINLGRTCLAYLLFDEFDKGPCLSQGSLNSRLQHYSFLDYATRNWADHLKPSGEDGSENSILQLLQTRKVLAYLQVFYSGSTSTFRWGYDDYKRHTPAPPITIAASFGFLNTVRLLLEQNDDINAINPEGQTALHIAAKRGHKAVVKLLLDNNAEVEAKDQSRQTSLLLAASNGHEAVVELLLENNAEVEAKDQSGQTSLPLATSNGHEAVVKLLLENNAEVEAKDRYERTSLLLAASRGHEAVVELLLENNAEVEAKDQSGQTSLLLAASNGHEAVVELLLENNAEVEAKDQFGQTSLPLATSNGHEAVVKLLLENNAEVEAKDRYGRTSLHIAASRGHEAVVELLLENNAEVKAKDQSGQTSLLLAASNGHKAVVELLLENNAEVEAKGRYGQTSLHIAASRGYKAVVELLLENNAEVEAKDRYGQTSLLLAASRGHEAVVELLLENNAEVEAKDQSGQTSLHLAASNGHEAVVKLLLENNAEVEAKDQSGQTSLPLATSNGHEAVVKLLLENNAEVEAKDCYGRTSLLLAASRGHEAVVELLLENNAEVEAKDQSGQTSLLLAASRGHKAVVELLFENNAEVEAKDQSGQTSLHIAVLRRYKAVVELLLENNAEVEAKDQSGQTSLHIAASRGYKAVVELLLENNAKVKAKDRYGRTSLHIAASEGHEAIAKLLLENGADVETRYKDGPTALLIAVSKGHKAVVELLLRNGANVEARHEDGQTVLHKAASNGSHAMVELILENGADVSARDKQHQTAMDIVIKTTPYSNNAMVKLMKKVDPCCFDEQEFQEWRSALLTTPTIDFSPIS